MEYLPDCSSKNPFSFFSYSKPEVLNTFICLEILYAFSPRTSAIIIFIMAVAGTVEGYTIGKSSRTIRKLLSLSPKTAGLVEKGQEVEISIQDIRPGDILLVRPGDTIFAGALNETGKLSIQAATEPEDTIFSQIAQTVLVACCREKAVSP